jgi:hypothetical protein
MTIAKKITQTKTGVVSTPVVVPAPAPAPSDFTSSGSVERVIPSISVVEVPVVASPVAEEDSTPTPDDSLCASHPTLEPTTSSHTESSSE